MKEYIPVITDREELYDKCENMEQLFDKYYLPLLDKHYSKTYKLQQECEELKKQLNYLRSGEYYNQLRFERDMLQNLVFYGEVSKEDKEFIDMTHMNTELLEENQTLKKQLENKNKQIEYLRRGIERKEDTIIDLQNERIPYTNEYVCKLKIQQKEFIEWLEEKWKTTQDIWYIKILNKYKEIIGVSNENNK